MSTALQDGLVVASHGRHVMVETPQGQRLICHPRSKKNLCFVGDRVQWLATQDEGTVEKLQPRRNLFYRQDEIRTKAFAANVDLVLILIAAEPEFSEGQLTRALIAAHAQDITPVIALNKSDLPIPFQSAWQRLQAYAEMGYTVLPLSVTGQPEDTLAKLQPHLAQRTTLILGPSGAGKSSLVNLLVPAARAATQEISQALRAGKHTTTSTQWYWLDETRESALIDSPGFQEFGLQHIPPMSLAAYMPDLAAHGAQCKFYNCTHLHEPGCGVREQLEHSITPARYKLYRDLFEELSRPKYG